MAFRLLIALLLSARAVEQYEFLANSSEDLRRLHLDENLRVVWSSHRAVVPQDVLTSVEGIPVETLEEDELQRYEQNFHADTLTR